LEPEADKVLTVAGEIEGVAPFVPPWEEGLGDAPRARGVTPVRAEITKSERIPTASIGASPERLPISFKRRPQVCLGCFLSGRYVTGLRRKREKLVQKRRVSCSRPSSTAAPEETFDFLTS